MRFIAPFLEKDLKKKMVFLGGPRQCGKTTLAKAFLRRTSGKYFNWDRISDRKALLQAQWMDQDELLVMDEIHKFKKWKGFLKGIYDTEKEKHRILITGSARLNVYQRGGDSLLGRYYYWRLHPFSLFENPPGLKRDEIFGRLMRVGGFPEPFFDNDETEARRWRESRARLVIREDVRDLERISDISALELLLNLLQERVGSTLAVSNLAQEIQISPVTCRKWLEVLEKMYLIFIVRGYDKQITRAVHKPIKVYFFDNAEVRGSEASRLENLVACHLLQQNQFIEDSTGKQRGLFYVRDKNQREVDFLVTEDNRPLNLVEVKNQSDSPSPNLLRFAEILKVQWAVQMHLRVKNVSTKGKYLLTDPIHFFNGMK
ncbi:MAG: hypothetical protein C5B49_00640 [Bdellovibrio sp.]|nr:MAG: hypothetical protein C5B49_00640 [Bdellovibrio sp.]